MVFCFYLFKGFLSVCGFPRVFYGFFLWLWFGCLVCPSGLLFSSWVFLSFSYIVLFLD